jgi:hypothetical protein
VTPRPWTCGGLEIDGLSARCFDSTEHGCAAHPIGTLPGHPGPAAAKFPAADEQRIAALGMLGDASADEDVVQEAFTGLYRRWAQLSGPAKALPNVRSSILNASRSQLRQLSRRPPGAEQALPPVASAAASALPTS